MPAIMDDPDAPTIYRVSGEPPYPDPHNPQLPGTIVPRQVTLRDRQTVATVVPFASQLQVPLTLLQYLSDQFKKEIEGGDTYPMIDPMPFDRFAAYWFQNFGAIMLLGSISSPEEVVEGKDWSRECLGSFYIKPNYPGRSSHVCNAGFLVTDASRNRGVGRLMGETYLDWAPKLGYTYSVFNLVYETNVASCKIWDGLGFKRIGRVKGCGNLKSYPGQLVDAIIYGRDLAGNEGEDLVSEERFDKIKFYLKYGKYPNGADRAEKSRLRSAATHYKLLDDDRLMLKGKEVISDPRRQYDISREVHALQHGGINRTTATIAERYHWSRIKETVSDVIRNCTECKELGKAPSTGGLPAAAGATIAAAAPTGVVSSFATSVTASIIDSNSVIDGGGGGGRGGGSRGSISLMESSSNGATAASKTTAPGRGDVSMSNSNTMTGTKPSLLTGKPVLAKGPRSATAATSSPVLSNPQQQQPPSQPQPQLSRSSQQARNLLPSVAALIHQIPPPQHPHHFPVPTTATTSAYADPSGMTVMSPSSTLHTPHDSPMPPHAPLPRNNPMLQDSPVVRSTSVLQQHHPHHRVIHHPHHHHPVVYVDDDAPIDPQIISQPSSHHHHHHPHHVQVHDHDHDMHDPFPAYPDDGQHVVVADTEDSFQALLHDAHRHHHHQQQSQHGQQHHHVVVVDDEMDREDREAAVDRDLDMLIEQQDDEEDDVVVVVEEEPSPPASAPPSSVPVPDGTAAGATAALANVTAGGDGGGMDVELAAAEEGGTPTSRDVGKGAAGAVGGGSGAGGTASNSSTRGTAASGGGGGEVEVERKSTDAGSDGGTKTKGSGGGGIYFGPATGR